MASDSTADFVATFTVGSPAEAGAQIQDELARTHVRRLYDRAARAAAGGFFAALCFWPAFYAHAPSRAVLLWALLVQTAQLGAATLAFRFKRLDRATVPAKTWLTRYRLALFLTASAWGLAPVMFFPANDPAYAAAMVLGLLAIAVGGLTTIVADREGACLWLLPIVVPLPLALLRHDRPIYVVLAIFILIFAAISLRLVLHLHNVLRSTLRAEFENGALVRRLHQQIELTAQTSREKSQFLASASHDLRQPLHALSFFGATLERRMAHSIDQPLIHNMMRSIEALDASFGAILDISKLDAGAVEPHVQSFPIRDLFRRLQMSFAGQAEEAGLQLRFSAGSKIVTSDPQLLERIMANLVQNGLRYSRPGMGVSVVARRRRGGISLEVWDSGIGIEESELPKIFAEFYQVANPGRDRGKGLGMGLAIVKRLSELLGHELTVRSKLGSGSVFRIWVARTHVEQMDEFAVGAETIPGVLDDSRTVLLIDDEEAIRTSVGELLAEWGYEVIAVPTIKDAVAATRKRDGMIDVVISDLRLRQGEDGLRAIEEVRQACGFAVPALLVSGDTAQEQVLRVHESGHIVLYKPVQAKELLIVLKKLA